MIDFSLYPDFPTKKQRQKRIQVKSQIGFLYNKSKTIQDKELLKEELVKIGEDLRAAEEKLAKLRENKENPDHEKIKRAK